MRRSASFHVDIARVSEISVADHRSDNRCDGRSHPFMYGRLPTDNATYDEYHYTHPDQVIGTVTRSTDATAIEPL